MRNSVEIRSAISDAKKRAKEIIDLAKKEVREMTEDEQKEMDGLKETIEEKKRELKELEEEHTTTSAKMTMKKNVKRVTQKKKKITNAIE